MNKTGGEIIVDALIEQGVQYILGIPGHGCLGIFDAIRDRVEKGLITYLQVKQEMSAMHLADGYYRASGKPLAVLTSIGAGAVNAALGVATAYVDSTSVILITGDAHTHMRGTGILQELERQQDSDFVSCMRPISKRCWRVETTAQLPRIMKRAFSAMLQGRRGPVVVSVPMDIQAEGMEVGDQKTCPAVPYTQQAVCASDIARAAVLVRNAKRPVILAGGGTYYARCYNLLVEFAEKLGAPVITTMASKSVFPEDHPLCGFHGGSKGTEAGNYLCRTADLVIALGCRFADETTSSYRKGSTYNFPECKLIHVDIDANELGKNYPCTLGVAADLTAFMEQLLCELGDYDGGEARRGYFSDIQQAKGAWLSKVEREALAPRQPVTISRFLYEMRRTIPENTMLVSSSGNSQAQIFQEYLFKSPGSFVTTGGFSTMGFALPAALGVQLANPEKRVMAVVGDGDFMMTMQEMSTAVQYHIPVVIVVLNNCGWLAIRDLQADVLGSAHVFGNDFTSSEGQLYSPDFSAIAKGFGMDAQTIPTTEEVGPALLRALELKKPALIEITVNREYPYSGGAATGWWDVPVPEYLPDLRAGYLEKTRDEYLR